MYFYQNLLLFRNKMKKRCPKDFSKKLTLTSKSNLIRSRQSGGTSQHINVLQNKCDVPKPGEEFRFDLKSKKDVLEKSWTSLFIIISFSFQITYLFFPRMWLFFRALSTHIHLRILLIILSVFQKVS